MPRHYTTRLSQKIVLEYLKSVYPEWKNFEDICDELPVVNIDCINLSVILQKLTNKKHIEEIKGNESTHDYYHEWRYINEKTN